MGSGVGDLVGMGFAFGGDVGDKVGANPPKGVGTLVRDGELVDVGFEVVPCTVGLVVMLVGLRDIRVGLFEDDANGVGDMVTIGASLTLGALRVGAAVIGVVMGALVAGEIVGDFDPGGDTFPNETASSHTAPKISEGTGGTGSKLNVLY